MAVWIKLRGDIKVKLTKEEVISFCKGKLAHFKIPKYIFFVENFPTTVTGKVQKFKMRKTTEQWIQEKTD